MGNDGLRGASAIHKARGLVVVESKDTAVINGMPGAVVRAGVAGRVLPLPAIGELLATLT
jgi:two-component system chemotaxis response regulator CheB